MSIFKTLGNKLKRAVSIKNGLALVTGNYTGLTAELKRVATTPDPKKTASASASVVMPNFEIPKEVNSILESQVKTFSNNVASKVASSKVAQDNINPINDFAFNVWLKATWQKNKVLFIGLGVGLVALIGWKFLKTPKRAKR